MTAKEKAKELIEIFKFVYVSNYTSMFEVRRCVLILVDEIIEETRDFGDTNHLQDRMNYWVEVKTEIEKL